jgi:asparagine synthase (glutamine-hydrolysing)
MCGICGLISYSQPASVADAVSRMCDSIAHRGPDGDGVFTHQHAAIAHRRLSIIDLEGGRQPMSTPDGQLHITYNGEIYNYRELRRQLEKRGCRFRTSSDTEVVLYAYQEWGRACVERFEGMFALAVLDLRRREILLARDHFGIKPLLYRVHPKSFAFASEFQALKTLPDWSGEIDLTSIDLYLRYQYIPAPRTAWRGVFKLPAGHRLIVGLDEPWHKIERYWSPTFTKPGLVSRRATAETIAEQLDHVVRDSVRRHLVADVPFGALLSGGIDSSLVVGYMSELSSRRVSTFSIGFDDQSVDELKYARRVASLYDTDHHEDVLQIDVLETLPEIVRHHGEPFGDQSAIPTWAVSKLARKSVPMVLSGDGGDELLGGYGTYGAWLRGACRGAGRTGMMDRCRSQFQLYRRRLLGRHRPAEPVEKVLSAWLGCVGRFSTVERESLWRTELRFLADTPDSQMMSALTAGASADIRQLQYCDLLTFLPEDILCKVDIASMRYGLEVRPPFLDRRVFELVRSLPASALYSLNATTGEYSGKLPLKLLAARRFGQDFAFRPKQGFVMPLQNWLQQPGMGQDAVIDRLAGASSHIASWFERAAIVEQVKRSRVVNVWLLLVLEEWLQQNRQPAGVAE